MADDQRPEDRNPEGPPPGPPPEDSPSSAPPAGPPPPPAPPTPYNRQGIPATGMRPPGAPPVGTTSPGGKPGMVTAIAVLTLVGGILSLLWGLAFAAGSMCVWIPWIVEVVAGVWGIIHGAQMLSNDRVPPNKVVAILFLFAILDCNPFSMTIGILLLVFANSPEVRDYYESQGIGY